MGKKYHYNTGIYKFNGGGAQGSYIVHSWQTNS